jgi:hypothetical protein
MTLRPASLDDKYDLYQSRVLVTGYQALIRACLMQKARDRQAGLHPLVISHGYMLGFHAEFDWTGTCDPTPWLCIPEAIRFMGGLLPGGWPELMRHNRSLTLQARDILCAALGRDPPAPNDMIGSMASIPLPAPVTTAIFGDEFIDLLEAGQIPQVLEPEMLEEASARAKEHGPAGFGLPP